MWTNICIEQLNMKTLAFTTSKSTKKAIEKGSEYVRKTPEPRHWRRFGVFIVNSEQTL